MAHSYTTTDLILIIHHLPQSLRVIELSDKSNAFNCVGRSRCSLVGVGVGPLLGLLDGGIGIGLPEVGDLLVKGIIKVGS